MSGSQSRETTVSLAQGAVNAIWPYVSGRRGLIVLAIGIGGAGMATNWGWLVAVGAAPILLALLPCAAMCALGLCMKKKGGGKSCSSGNKTPAKRSDFKGGPDGGA